MYAISYWAFEIICYIAYCIKNPHMSLSLIPKSVPTKLWKLYKYCWVSEERTLQVGLIWFSIYFNGIVIVGTSYLGFNQAFSGKIFLL